MTNDSMEKDLKPSVLFFRNGKSYYYKFNGETHEINAITIDKLKQQLTLPFKVQFYAMSIAQTEKIVSILLDSTTAVTIKRIINGKDNILRFEAIFIQQEIEIEADKIEKTNQKRIRINFKEIEDC